MKYILLMQFAMAAWKEGNIGNWASEDIQANVDYLRRFNKDLVESGEFVVTEGLGGPEGLRVVRAGDGGTPIVSDGPFPESKEFLAGYYIVDVESAERAYALAARLSAMPGQGGVPSNIPIEVRAVMGIRSADW